MLPKCLDALKKQNTSLNDVEVIIVDNSLQPDKSAEFKNNIKGIPNLSYYITNKSGLSYARNYAIEKCQTKYIAFIDDDSILHPDWLYNLKNTLDSTPSDTGAIGGKVLPIWLAERPEWLSDKMLNALTILDWGDGELEIDDFINYWLVGANVIYNTDAVKQVGGFSEKLGRQQDNLMCHEELDLNLRLYNRGYKIKYQPSIKVNHFVYPYRLTKEHYYKLMYSEGYSKALLRSKDNEISADLKLTDEFSAQKNIDLNLFVDVNDPNLFEKKMFAISKLGRLISQITRLKEILHQKDLEVTNLSNEIDLFKKIINTKEKVLSEKEKIISELSLEIETINQKNIGLTKLAEEFDNLLRDNNMLNEKINALLEDNNFYKQRLEKMSKNRESDIRKNVISALIEERLENT